LLINFGLTMCYPVTLTCLLAHTSTKTSGGKQDGEFKFNSSAVIYLVGNIS